MAFDAVNAALILSKGVGIPPNDMQSFNAQSQEDGIKITMTGPKNSYVYSAENSDTLVCTPAGVMVRYSDTDYPADINDGTLLGVYNENYNPANPTEVTDNLIGLVFEQTYYFSAFPFSVDGIYNKSQAPANRASAQWVGNKGTINVTVATYEGYTGGEIGEYTITLVDQAQSSPSNIERTASGTGLTQIGNLEAGKTYVVTLTDVGGLTCDPSEPITIVAGETYNVTMTYREKYGTISVTVTTANDAFALGEYKITLLDQASESPQNIEKQATGKTTTVFENLIAGKQYKVRLGPATNWIAPVDSDTLTVLGGDDVAITMTYSPGLGSVVINVTTNPTGMPIGSYTITLTPTAGGSSLQQSGNGSQSLTFNTVPIGTYNITGSSINHYTFSGGQVSVTGGQQSSHNAHYGYNATLSEASWSEISAISQAGMASSVWSVGDTKSFSVSSQDLTARIIGFNFDNKTSGGKAGISFDTTTLLAQKMNLWDEDDNYGGFLEMYLGNYLNSSFVNLLPTDMQQALASVNKETENVNESMKVFIFSRNEILGNPTTGAGRYPLYTSGNSYRKKMPNESSYEDYWLRTRYYGSIYQSVGSNGYIENDHNATESLGVAIGFCV